MGEKRIGKEYKAEDFAQPAKELKSNSRTFLYVGLAVFVLAAVVGGVFLLGLSEKFRGVDGLTGATTIHAYCVDSDGGYNRFTKGVVAGIYYLNYEEGEYVDTCASGEENKLTEYYCKNDLIVFSTEPCPQGMLCQNDICTI